MLVKENIWYVNYNTTQFRSELIRFQCRVALHPDLQKNFHLIKENKKNIVQPVTPKRQSCYVFVEVYVIQ